MKIILILWLVFYHLAAKAGPQQFLLLNDGKAALEERLRLIELAKSSIEVEYFIFNRDISGSMVLDALAKKAQEGVRVRILIDYLATKKTITSFVAQELVKLGIEIKYYNPTPMLTMENNYRNHRKFLIVDEQYFITGGRNIGDEYFDLDKNFSFLDRDVSLEGELAIEAKRIFEKVWSSSLSQTVQMPLIPQKNDIKYSHHTRGKRGQINDYKDDIREYLRSQKNAKDFIFNKENEVSFAQIRKTGKLALAQEVRATCENPSLVSDLPWSPKQTENNRQVKYEIYRRIENSQKSVLMDAPYFLLDGESNRSFSSALKKGVEIEIITNTMHSTDLLMVSAAFDRYAASWIHQGMKFFLFKGEKKIKTKTDPWRLGLHSKSFVFDDEDVVIGSFNLDPRSANLNLEAIIVCEGNLVLASALKGQINQVKESSFPLIKPSDVGRFEFYRVSFWKRMKYYLSKIPASWIYHYL